MIGHLENGTVYCFTVRAMGPGGASDFSDGACAAAGRQICVLNSGTESVPASLEIFDATLQGDAPPRIVDGNFPRLAVPDDVYVDLVNDEIFIANRGNNSITVYPRTVSGNLSPLRVLSGSATGISAPEGIALDLKHSEIFVANRAADSITVYAIAASGNVPPLRTLHGPSTGLLNPLALTVCQ